MPLDPEFQALLEARKRVGIPPVSQQSLEEVRGSRKEWRVFTPVPKAEVDEIFDEDVAVEDGAIKVRVYRHAGAADRPCILYFHGGGWVLGDLDHSDALCRRLAADSGCVVVNVDYRLAPEHRFPTAAEDCYEAFVWAVVNADRLGIDRLRIAISGGSAGGNLAAAVVLMARDRGGQQPAAQVLAYPVLDNACSSPSYVDFAEGYLVGTEDMGWYWRQYLAGANEGESRYACPLKETNLSGLPPTLVITAEYDPVRDDGERYAARLISAGVETTYSCYPGTLHGFFAMPGAMAKGTQAVGQAVDFLASVFARSN